MQQLDCIFQLLWLIRVLSVEPCLLRVTEVLRSAMEGQFCCWQDPAKKKISELISGYCRWVGL